MKFLKNQGIVIVLAAFAVLLVGKNLVWPFLKPKFASAPKPAPAAANPTPTPNQDTKTTALQNAAQTFANRVAEVMKSAQSQLPANQAPHEKMEAQALQAQLAAWVASPHRDPFKTRGSVSDKPAREQLMLTGILRQTDSELAVINGLILKAGEMILGFQIELVEADRVWVTGPNGRESIEFKYFVSTPEKVVTVEVQPATPDAAKPAPREEAPPEPAAPVSPAPILVTPKTPVVGEADKGSRRQGIAGATDFTSGPPIDR